VQSVRRHYEGERSQDGESEPECSDSARTMRAPSGRSTDCAPPRSRHYPAHRAHSDLTASAVRIRAATPAGYTPANTAATTTSTIVSPRKIQGTCNSMSHPNA
jgi:hypothetical protein